MCDQYWQLLLSDYYAGREPSPSGHPQEKFAPHMKFMGRVLRFTPMKDTARRDQYFHEFVRSGAINYTEKYRMATPNRDAMTQSISKYNRPQPTELNEKAWEIAVDWCFKHFSPHMGQSRVIDHDKARRDLDRTTSPGYPWSRFWQNKGQFLDSEEAPKVEKQFWDSLITNDPNKAFWTASLKRELRPMEKLKENKIRTFTASATELSVATTRLCWDANQRFYESNNKTWGFVGGSKFYQGFDRLYRRLNKHPNAFELDETAYDSSLFVKAMESVRDLRWRLYHDVERTPDNKKRLWEVYSQIINSVIVLDNGEVFQKNTGNPSGSANTIVDNTLILFMLLAYAWIMIMLEKPETEKYATYEHFMELVEAALNGDDNTFTVAEEVVAVFNATSVSRVWTLLGVVTKSPNYNPRKLSDVEFLSHGFIRMHNMWLPICERDKALCSLMWGSEVDDVRFTLLRAYALRIETWPDEQARKDIMMFIDWLRSEFKHELKGTIPDTDLTMLRIHSVFKTDGELKRLYCLPPVLEGCYVKKPSMDCLDSKHSAILYSHWIDHICSQMRNDNRFAALNDDEEEIIGVSHVERHRNVHADSMPKGKGNKKKGGTPSKQEMKRREAQSKRDKATHEKKQSVTHHKAKAPKERGEPLARSSTLRNTSPTQMPLKRREFLGTYTSGMNNNAFDLMDSFALNPGLQKTLPWGFAIANQFEKWLMRRMKYVWEPRCPDTTVGSVLMVCDYDSRDTAYSTYTQAANAAGSIEKNPYKRIDLNINPKMTQTINKMMVRAAGQPSNTDIRMYDAGVMYLFFLNESSSTPIVGDLFVEYELELYQPVGAQNSTPSLVCWDHSEFKYNGSFCVPQTQFGNGAFRPTVVNQSSSSTAVVWSLSAGVENQGQYMIVLATIGFTTTGLTNPNVVSSSGISNIQAFGAPGSTAAYVRGVTNGGGFTVGGVMVYTFNVTGPGIASITLDTGCGTNGDHVDVITTFMGYPVGGGVRFGKYAPPKNVSPNAPDQKTIDRKEVIDRFADKLVAHLLTDEKAWLKVSEPTTPDTKAAADSGPLTALTKPQHLATISLPPPMGTADVKTEVPGKGKSKK